jgi:Flp pilus assembly protein TadG
VVSEALTSAPPISTIITTIRKHLFAIAQPIAARPPVALEYHEMFEAIRSMCKTGGRWFSRTGVARRFARQQDGSAVVEFALVITPFLVLLFAIFETTLIFFSGQALETAVADASRLILTGQAQGQGMSQADFKSAVCAKIYGLFNCQQGVYVDVKTFSSFSGVTMPSPVDAQGNFQNNFSYQPGGPCDIVVVRLFYQWPLQVPLLGLNKLSDMNGNSRVLVATSAFRNEPFGNSTCS